MAATASNRAQAVKALKLQRERSATYQQWMSLFYRALIDDITVTELQRSIQGIILPEFQRISSQLQALRKSLMEAAVEAEHPRSGRCSPPSASAAPTGLAVNQQQTTSAPPSSCCAKATALAMWITRLQDLEREHYTVAVGLANHMVEHCTPNVRAESERPLSAVAASGAADKQNAETDTQKRSGESAGIKSIFKPDSSDDDELYERVERQPKAIAHGPPDPSTPTAAVPAPAPVAPTLRVHDVERCALPRLIPQRYHTYLYFVTCRGAADDLDGSSDHSANDSDGADSERRKTYAGTDLVALPAKGARSDGAPTIARYAPSAVACRCAKWSSAVATILRQQMSLRTAIEDLCEELQGEISDDG
ncbi:hypothetical protein LSCM1_05407 [Leishmania martiniquensis]|uniref:Uncharacterized protein n=1 Tax=Leishmania martiniquensis TaxID=1580590 RepID=A0A836KL65_9TRYP|nr:hypothetical protein LSCM1_05407 [Leishmania martiniquensis]